MQIMDLYAFSRSTRRIIQLEFARLLGSSSRKIKFASGPLELAAWGD
jgi:hypothetical protein